MAVPRLEENFALAYEPIPLSIKLDTWRNMTKVRRAPKGQAHEFLTQGFSMRKLFLLAPKEIEKTDLKIFFLEYSQNYWNS